MDEELAAFQARYLAAIGVRLAYLDQVQAAILDFYAQRSDSEEATLAATQAREQSERSTAALVESAQRHVDLPPTDELRRLFRRVVKVIHPDLARDDDERRVLNELMAEANAAYRDGDLERLKAVLDAWLSDPRAKITLSTEEEHTYLLGAIERARTRIRELEECMASLRTSDLYRLMRKSQRASRAGNDLLAALAEELDSKIAAAQHTAEELGLELNDRAPIVGSA